MQQIPASLPADPAAASAGGAKKGASSEEKGSGFTRALLGAAKADGQSEGQAQGGQGAASAPAAAAAKGAAGSGAKSDGAEGTQADPAAAISAAVLEAIERHQQAIKGAQGTRPTDGTALGTTVPTPGRTGQTPANGALPPGQAGTAPGLAAATPGQAGTTPGLAAATPGKADAADPAQAATGANAAKGKAAETLATATQQAGAQAADGVKTAALPVKPQVGGIPTDVPKTDAHGSNTAKAAIEAGALQGSAEKNAQAAANTPTPDPAAARNEGRAAEPGRAAPTPLPANAELAAAPPDTAGRATGSSQPIAGQTAELQPTSGSATSPGVTAAGADAAQPGSPAQPRPVMPAQPIAEQVAVQIQRAAGQGLDRIMIHLNPPELGRVDVRMEVGHDGRIQAIIAADSPDALDTLRQDMRGLERALNDAGLKTDQGSLSFELRGEGRGGSKQPPQDQADGTPNETELADLMEEFETSDASGWIDGIVDIRV